MRRLFHTILDPASRTAIMVLMEKRLEFEPLLEHREALSETFRRLSPLGHLPLLVEEDGFLVSGPAAIAQYLEAEFDDPPLLGEDRHGRATILSRTEWFDGIFNDEVTRPLLGERVVKWLARSGAPDGKVIRTGQKGVVALLQVMEGWLGSHNWIAGTRLSLADLTAAAHLSVLDYISEVPWDQAADVKDWYARMKSRPSFRPVLQETIPSLQPAAHYRDLDF